MRSIKTKVYQPQPDMINKVAENVVFLYKDEIYFINGFGKSIKADTGCKCLYFLKPNETKYPFNCNLKIYCEYLDLILFAKIEEDQIMSFYLMTRRLWIVQEDFQKNILIALLSGGIGGIIASLAVQAINKLG